MRYAQIRPMDISNGEGIGVALFVQGCPIHCKGCFQPETWDFDGGKEFENEHEFKLYLLLTEPYITRFSILGGEPLAPQNIDGVSDILTMVRRTFPEIKIWLWTGYTYEQILDRIKASWRIWEEPNPDYLLVNILEDIDYLIAGPFIEEEKDLTLLWRGSRNQEVIDMKQTLATGKKVTYV